MCTLSTNEKSPKFLVLPFQGFAMYPGAWQAACIARLGNFFQAKATAKTKAQAGCIARLGNFFQAKATAKTKVLRQRTCPAVTACFGVRTRIVTSVASKKCTLLFGKTLGVQWFAYPYVCARVCVRV